ncbi:MAG: hypothetical protein M1814_001123 [Vezdaea aestivalis]|nr:MAG: hypothetical protein M1814_001123 [Vezdaea aestivalis]
MIRNCICARRWKTPQLIVVLFAIELAGTVASLAMFGVASPNTYRTDLWKDGGLNGFNSDPDAILFAYANYEPIPKIPLIWSQFQTNFNVIVSVLSMFVLLIKGVMWVMHLWMPLISLIMHSIITALWAFSVYAQASPDYSDPKHPSKLPWYLTKSCSVAKNPARVYHGCTLAKGTFAVTVIMLALFAFHLPLAIYSMIPGKSNQHNRMDSDPTEMDLKRAGTDNESPASETSDKPNWSSQAQNPMTPRTLAFNTLSNDLPLRNHK